MTATTRGATPVTGGHGKRRKGGLWVALLALLLLAVLAAVLIARGDKNDDASPSRDPRSTTTVSSTATNAPVTTAPSAGGDGQSATTGGAGAAGERADVSTTGAPGVGGSLLNGTVMSGTTRLLPVPSGGLASFAGQDAEGVAAPVESVVADEGFWGRQVLGGSRVRPSERAGRVSPAGAGRTARQLHGQGREAVRGSGPTRIGPRRRLGPVAGRGRLHRHRRSLDRELTRPLAALRSDGTAVRWTTTSGGRPRHPAGCSANPPSHPRRRQEVRSATGCSQRCI